MRSSHSPTVSGWPARVAAPTVSPSSLPCSRARWTVSSTHGRRRSAPGGCGTRRSDTRPSGPPAGSASGGTPFLTTIWRAPRFSFPLGPTFWRPGSRRWSKQIRPGAPAADGRKSRHPRGGLPLTASNADEWLASQPGTEILPARHGAGHSGRRTIPDDRRLRRADDPQPGRCSPEAVAARTGFRRRRSRICRLFSDRGWPDAASRSRRQPRRLPTRRGRRSRCIC